MCSVSLLVSRGVLQHQETVRYCSLSPHALTSYPGLLTPTNVEEGLLNTLHAVTYSKFGWTCGGLALDFCTVMGQLSEPEKRRQGCLILTTQLLCGPWLQSVACSLYLLLLFRKCATPPYIHPASRYITVHNNFYQAFLHISITGNKFQSEKV